MPQQADQAVDKDVNSPPSPAARLGFRLRQARLRLNMTQSEVAAANFSVSYISAVERGQIRPSLGALEVLSDRLQVPLEDLLGNAPLPGATTGVTSAQAADRRQEEAEARLNAAQVLSYQRKYQASVDSVRQIAMSHLSQAGALEARRLLAYNFVELDQGEDARREAQEGVTIAERQGEDEARARLRNELGNAYMITRKLQLALEQYKLAYDAIEQQIALDPMFKVNVLYNLGNVNWLLGHNDDSIGYLSKAVELAADVNNPERLGDTLWALSVAYQGKGDVHRAKLYALRSLAAYEQGANESLTARAYTRLGRATAQANQIDDALRFLEKAQTLSEQQNDVRVLAEVRRSLAAVYISQGKLAEAAAAAQEALSRAEEVGDVILRAEARLTIASLEQAQGNAKQAKASFEEAIAMLEGVGAPQHLADAYASYSEYLDQHGEKQRAFDLLKQAWRLRENPVNA